MPLTSMTGFARAQGARTFGGAAGRPALEVGWSWEGRSVNGKGLDVRLRWPPGHDSIEGPARALVQKAFGRGNVSFGLTVTRDQQQAQVSVNEALLSTLAETAQRLAERFPALEPARLDGLMQCRGVLEAAEPALDEAERAALDRAMLETLEEALSALSAARAEEGAALDTIVRGQLDHIETLAGRAAETEALRPEAVRARLAEKLDALLSADQRLEPERIAQEAALIAAKGDVREELDRLAAHIAAARELMAAGGPVGRRFDFLCQEFNREANTLCSKANDTALTAIGLELKAVIEQMREQIQNVE